MSRIEMDKDSFDAIKLSTFFRITSCVLLKVD